MPGSDREPWDEADLRRFLERTVPRLPAPEERMSGLRRRVVRRRRRRAAVGATAVGAAAAVFVLATSPGPRQVAPPPLPPAASAPDQGTTVSVPTLAQLGYRLPPGWTSTTGTVTGGTNTVAFATTDPLPPTRPSCSDQKDVSAAYCPPLGSLRPGGALVVFRLAFQLGKLPRMTGVQLTEATPEPDCLAVGATRQLEGILTTGRTGPDAQLVISVCLNTPTDPTLTQARTIAASATIR